MSNIKKINWLLILQGWAMLWVVIGHSTVGTPGEGPGWENVLYHFAYSFHMPLFMLVSGWLFYLTRLEVKENAPLTWSYGLIIWDKSLRLLLPGLFFSFIAFVLKLAFPGEMARQTGFNIHDIVYAYLYPYDNPFRELWFIVTLFWLMMLTPLWRLSIKKSMAFEVGVALLLAVLHFCHPNIELLCIGKVFSHAVWFYLGLVICKERIVETVFRKNKCLTVIIGIVFYYIGIYTNPFVTTISGILFSFGVALIADKYLPQLFCGFRTYTYQIFLMGIFVQIGVKIVYRHVPIPYLGAFLLCILVGLYVPVVISKMLEWINWKPILMCVGLKNKK